MRYLLTEIICNNNEKFRSFKSKENIHTLNVTTSGRNCNTIFDVLTSKMPNADR